MKKTIKILSLVLCTLSLCTCSNPDSTLDMKGMFSPNGPTVKTRFAESMAYNDLRGEMHLNMASDDYTIYICTDSHITRKTHRNLDYFISQYRAAAGPKLALHLGDIIDAQNNFPCGDSILRLANDALFITPLFGTNTAGRRFASDAKLE